jgi:hypothetical protein
MYAFIMCLCYSVCAGIGLATGSFPFQVVLATVSRLRKGKSGQDPGKGCTAIDR